ncbi:MAG: hypothetical protein LUQ69_01475 [Methanoregulaceae archaeon]|nr:hypothetical protein [Methanoregulaceae archaeon]
MAHFIPDARDRSPYEYHRLHRLQKREQIKGYEKGRYVARSRVPGRTVAEVITYKHGTCERCGISFNGVNQVIFDLHHPDPEKKDITLGHKLLHLTKEEIDAYILVCKNCHALIHDQENR